MRSIRIELFEFLNYLNFQIIRFDFRIVLFESTAIRTPLLVSAVYREVIWLVYTPQRACANAVLSLVGLRSANLSTARRTGFYLSTHLCVFTEVSA